MTPLYHPGEPLSHASGIYRIMCTVTGKIYIGSSNDMYERCYRHRRLLNRNEHPNHYLQAAWNVHGPDAFTFDVLEFVLPPSLIVQEQYWFDKLLPFDEKGFNLNRIAGSTLGRPVSHATRDKIRAKNRGRTNLPHKGKPLSLEHRAKISSGNKGKVMRTESVRKSSEARRGAKRSAESRAKMSEVHKGIPLSEEARAKVSAAGKKRFADPEARAKARANSTGKRHTEETKAKLRDINKGRTVSAETRAKLSAFNKGKFPSPETRAKLSAAHKAKVDGTTMSSAELGAASQRKTLVVTAPDGTEYLAHGINKFCREHGLNASALICVAKGKYPMHKGWKARYFPESETS